MKSKHVIVCGAGIVGLSCAYQLRARGHEVTVIDREPEARDGCSFGNAGMIVPSHVIPLAAPGMVTLGLKWMFNPKSPFRIKPSLSADLIAWCLKFIKASTHAHTDRCAPIIAEMSLASRALYEEFEQATANEFGFVKRGLVMLCKSQEALDAEGHVVELARKHGVPAEVHDAAGLAKLDPDVRMNVAGGVYFPKDCHLPPERFLATLLRLAKQAGVRFQWSTEITGWQKTGSRLTHVVTKNGAVAADEFVLAGGVWSPALVGSLGLKIPVQPGKGYSMTLAKARQLPRLCSILTEARVAVTPMGTSLRVGGTMELGAYEKQVSQGRVTGILESVPRYLPEFSPADFLGIPVWHGLRPCSPDGMPYVGRFAAYDNLVAAAGHAMMGLSLGPITGKLVGEIVSGQKPSIDLTLLNPDRYA